MRVWFRHLTDFLSSEEPEDCSVRKELRAAASESMPIGLGLIGSDTHLKADDGFIEELEADAVKILTPRAGGLRAIPGEHLMMAVDTGSGFHVGEVNILGTWEQGSGAALRRGIRVSIPHAMEHVQRREHHRLLVAFDLAPRAELESGDPAQPIGIGSVLDISNSGARVRAKLSAPLHADALITLKAFFPEPFPPFEAQVAVVHVGRSGDSETSVLGLRFTDEHPELARAIHQLERRRATRFCK